MWQLHFFILLFSCFCSRSTAFNVTGVQINSSSVELDSTGPIQSCRDLPNTDQALLQHCAQRHKRKASGWVLIQQRVFGKVDFFRSWMTYREGFGNCDNDFWLGLEKIHRMTRFHHYELLVELVDYHDLYKIARYTRFELAGEDEGYALRHLGSYSGSAGDSLRGNVGMKFSTYDNDNDQHETVNCALKYSSGWWFTNCGESRLNGLAVNKENEFAISWWRFSNKWHSMKYTRMMIRLVQ